MLCIRVDAGLMSVISSAHSGGWMARRFLPSAIVLTVIAAWIRYQGQRFGLYGTEVGLVLFLTANIVIMSGLACIIARRLNTNDALFQAAELEQSRLLVERERRVSDGRFQSLFELSVDCIGLADFDGHFQVINDSFVKALGYCTPEFVGRSFFDFVHPDDLDNTTKAYEDQLKRGQSVLSFTNRYKRKDGTDVLLEWTARPDAASATIFAIGRDVTERSNIEAEQRTQATLLTWPATPLS